MRGGDNIVYFFIFRFMKYLLVEDIPGFKARTFKEEAEFAPYECAKYPEFFLPLGDREIPEVGTKFFYLCEAYDSSGLPIVDVNEDDWEFVMGEEKKGAWDLRYLLSNNFFLNKEEAQKKADILNTFIRNLFNS
jgi:hypothetical protein